MNSLIFASVVIVTVVATNLLAFLRKGDTFITYSADPNAHGVLPITFSILGTIVGGGMFLAVGQIGYEAGITGYIVGIATLIGLFITGIFASRLRTVMDDNKVNSLIDLLEKLFSLRVALIFSSVSALMYFFLLAGQFVALYSFAKFSAQNMQHQWLPWILVCLGGLSMIFYPIIGGLRKDILTDLFQMILIIFVAIYLVILFIGNTTAVKMYGNLPVDHLTGVGGKGYGPLFLIGVLLFMPGLFMIRMDIWQRIRAAKDSRAVTIAMIISGIASLLFYLIFTSMGMWAFVGGIKDAKQATLGIVLQMVTNPLMLGLVIGAFFAAVLSSADTFINNASIFVTRLIVGSDWGAAWTDNRKGRDVLLKSRIIALLLILGSAILAWTSGDFVDLLVGAFTLLLMFLPTILGTFIESWRCEKGAFYSSLIGVICFITLFFLWNPKMAFAPSIFLSILLYTVICRMSKTRC